jgi:type IV pilus assembly protein PilX
MMTNNPMPLSPQSRQSGAALITGLIFLVVLTMIGITAARMSTLEERMSGNMRDRSIAMQAAELALRDAERDIQALGTAVRTTPISGISHFVANCNQDGTSNTFDDGLCYNGPAGYGVAIWTTANMTAAPSVAYGRFTGATAIAGLSAQPRYVIEGIRKTPPGGGELFYYRITVRAQGANPNTVVWLQEVFRP